ncbi:hypothetical protein LSG31_19375 [Fodinisporobacter ferrooxydans]|uniref:Aspartyl protease n=1 Tax=Fodinisporobacter ferrooxydans TaxID=2901836 RepID=A0ABY4CLF6_9BACL|nr:hypothetical protein LSG31_19375 [Alicyclobacillaceae bacterium MYW30-H2]
MKINLVDGLLFTSLVLTHRGKSTIIENVIIDTGASRTIISIDAAEK